MTFFILFCLLNGSPSMIAIDNAIQLKAAVKNNPSCAEGRCKVLRIVCDANPPTVCAKPEIILITITEKIVQKSDKTVTVEP